MRVADIYVGQVAVAATMALKIRAIKNTSACKAWEDQRVLMPLRAPLMKEVDAHSTLPASGARIPAFRTGRLPRAAR
jgi:hypothetical protein